MSSKILILGDGASGTIMANKLRFLIPREDADITVLGNSPMHYFKPDGIHIPFGLKMPRDSVKPAKMLFNYGINYIQDEAVKIDVDNRKVNGKSGKEYDYDYLIIGTGDRYTPEDIPGYAESALHFYDYSSSIKLRDALNNFKGGKIVVGPSSIPYQCPPAPYEFTFQLDQYLRNRGIRDKTEIHYTYPLNRAFTIANVSEFVEKYLEEKGVILHTLFNVESIDAKSKKVNSLEGESVDYDLLVLIPPHRGQQFITDSGLAGPSGFIDVDRYKLNYGNFDNVFALGDATNLPVSKAGATAHFQSEYLANRIAHEISGDVYFESYDGAVACTTVTGPGEAITLYFTYEHPPRANFNSKMDYLLKWTSADTYFSGMVRGIM
ncbi:MAG: NAD(P)/FAD-dependent oxidoreductase [Candidatus Thermoplasmatota archaeon]|nr:NAD(P)/FAD-dependent oxidoreductase [Candidatus Thermoplasmatota archaeon]